MGHNEDEEERMPLLSKSYTHLTQPKGTSNQSIVPTRDAIALLQFFPPSLTWCQGPYAREEYVELNEDKEAASDEEEGTSTCEMEPISRRGENPEEYNGK